MQIRKYLFLILIIGSVNYGFPQKMDLWGHTMAYPNSTLSNPNALALYGHAMACHHADPDSGIEYPYGSMSGWNNPDFDPYDILLFDHFNYAAPRELGVRAGAFINSNAVTLPFSFTAIENNFIDDDKKNSVSQKLKAKNAFEFNLSGELFYRFETDSFLFHGPALYSITFRMGSIQQIKFPKDLFTLIFIGNAVFAGQTADISKTKALSYNFNQLRFGVQKALDAANNWRAGLGLSILTAKYGSAIQIDHGTLFTEQNGEYLDATYHFNYFTSDSSNSGKLQVDGIGASADFTLSYSGIDNNSTIILYANDVGFIGWNKHSLLYSADSSLHFEGLQINDLFSPNDSSLLHINTDTILKKTGTSVEVTKHATLLPFEFSGVYVRAINEKWIASAGISYRPFPDTVPLIFIQPRYFFTPNVRGALQLGYGGTNKFRIGLEFDAVVFKRIFVQVGSGNILGALIPKKTTSTSLFCQASLRL